MQIDFKTSSEIAHRIANLKYILINTHLPVADFGPIEDDRRQFHYRSASVQSIGWMFAVSSVFAM